MPEEHLPATAQGEPTPLVLIQQALENKYNPADLKDLFELQRMHAADLAERQYADAITAFQAEVPLIGKNAENKHSGKRYADYEGIMRTIMPLLRKHRIVVTFDTAEDGQKMMTTCRVRVGTVEKHTTITLPVEAASKQMNAMQTGGTAMSYGRRYALTAALNLVTTGEDTDGQNYGPNVVGLNNCAVNEDALSQAEFDELDRLWDEWEKVGRVKVNEARFLHWLGAGSLASINRHQWEKACTDFRQKTEAKKQESAKAKAGGAA